MGDVLNLVCVRESTCCVNIFQCHTMMVPFGIDLHQPFPDWLASTLSGTSQSWPFRNWLCQQPFSSHHSNKTKPWVTPPLHGWKDATNPIEGGCVSTLTLSNQVGSKKPMPTTPSSSWYHPIAILWETLTKSLSVPPSLPHGRKPGPVTVQVFLDP